MKNGDYVEVLKERIWIKFRVHDDQWNHVGKIVKIGTKTSQVEFIKYGVFEINTDALRLAIDGDVSATSNPYY